MATVETPTLTEHEQFLARRRTCIGGSDAHHLLNIEPYGCRRQLAYDKQGVEADEEFPINGNIRRGVQLEAIAADAFAEQTGRKVELVEFARHPKHPWAGVHMDRMEWPRDDEDFEGPGYLELKCPRYQVIKKAKEEGISLAYVAQVQWGIWVKGWSWGSFGLYEATEGRVIPWDFRANRELQEMLEAAGKEFWPLVGERKLPPRLEVTSEQCEYCRWRRTCWGTKLDELPVSEAATLMRSKPLQMWTEVYAQYRDIEKLAKEEKEKARIEMARLIGDETKVRVLGTASTRGATISFAPRRTWNKKKLAAEKPDLVKQYAKLDETKLSDEHPELMADYRTCSGTRTLRVDLKDDED